MCQLCTDYSSAHFGQSFLIYANNIKSQKSFYLFLLVYSSEIQSGVCKHFDWLLMHKPIMAPHLNAFSHFCPKSIHKYDAQISFALHSKHIEDLRIPVYSSNKIMQE